MCEPTTILLATTIASSAAGLFSQYQQGKAMNEQIEAEAANRNEAIAAQQEQMRASTSEELSQAALEAQKERSRLRVLQAEGALQGLSGERRFDEVDFNLGSQQAAIRGNYDNAIAQVQREGRAAVRSDKAQARAVKKPDWIGAGLQIAGGVADYKMAKKQKVT